MGVEDGFVVASSGIRSTPVQARRKRYAARTAMMRPEKMLSQG